MSRHIAADYLDIAALPALTGVKGRMEHVEH